MKYILIFTIAVFVFSCKHKTEDADQAYKSMRQDTINVLKKDDSAVIAVFYPQGTAWYQYEFSEDSDRVELTNHTTHHGDPDEAGGGMSETFYIKAVKPGMDTVRIVDRSPAAMKAAADTVKPFKNYELYVLKVE